MALIFLWFVLAVLSLWSIAALYYDVPIPAARIPLAIAFALVILAIVLTLRSRPLAPFLCLACFCVVLAWWLTLRPTNRANWQPDVARTASATLHGDQVTLHNLRNCDYRTETSYTDCWHDRTVDLSQIRGADFFLTNWGLRWISHPIVSFQFANGDHVAFSIEARYKAGESYSTLRGFFRQYELILVAADERDVIRLRTNYRKEEEVYLYRTTLSPQMARKVFLTYIAYLNQLNVRPEWYNALTRNCTTAIDKQIAADVSDPHPWNYQLILNGTLDHLLYERGRLVSDGLSFPQLRQREHINAAAHAANASPDFSALIRVGRVGF
jgi:hypothetical protein